MIQSKGTKNLSATSIRKIRRMIAAVLAEPKLYNQYTFGKQTSCGTTSCGAGWAVWLFDRKTYNRLMSETLENGGYLESNEWEEAAFNALDLVVIDDGDEYAFDNARERLFGSPNEWPERYAKQYAKAKTAKTRAKAFAARWEAFIASDGLE